MNMKSIEVKVGAFVVVCAFILAATVYYVSGAQLRGKQVPYRTYLRYAGGLEPGTGVLFGGISVGKVTSVRPDPADPTRIEISLAVKQGTPLNARSMAKLGSISLMSSPVVSITTGSNDAARLAPGAVIPSLETVSVDEMQRKIVALADSAQHTLATVKIDLNHLTGDARHVLANLNQATGRANQEHVAAILSNADRVTAQLSSKIGPTIDKVNTTVSDADGTITAIRDPVQADLAELRRTLDATHNLVGNLQSLLSANNQNITYSLENIRMTTDNLNDLTQSVKEQPWSLIRIKQPEDRKVPQEEGK
jgi:phospholipid/cholesterol/gamma-HCH transport system substrate-binding protein